MLSDCCVIQGTSQLISPESSLPICCYFKTLILHQYIHRPCAGHVVQTMTLLGIKGMALTLNPGQPVWTKPVPSKWGCIVTLPTKHFFKTYNLLFILILITTDSSIFSWYSSPQVSSLLNITWKPKTFFQKQSIVLQTTPMTAGARPQAKYQDWAKETEIHMFPSSLKLPWTCQAQELQHMYGLPCVLSYTHPPGLDTMCRPKSQLPPYLHSFLWETMREFYLPHTLGSDRSQCGTTNSLEKIMMGKQVILFLCSNYTWDDDDSAADPCGEVFLHSQAKTNNKI